MADTTTQGALSRLRHLYANLIGGGVRDTAQAKRIAEGLLAPAIAELERAQAPAPQGPSDAELEATRAAFDWDGWTDPKAAQRGFARAVLARWGAAT